MVGDDRPGGLVQLWCRHQRAPFIRLWIFVSGCEATIRRNVPERERITIDSVSTRSPTTRTPRSRAPLVTPVAATKTSSP